MRVKEAMKEPLAAQKFFQETKSPFRNLFWNNVLHYGIEFKPSVFGFAHNAIMKLVCAQVDALENKSEKMFDV